MPDAARAARAAASRTAASRAANLSRAASAAIAMAGSNLDPPKSAGVEEEAAAELAAATRAFLPSASALEALRCEHTKNTRAEHTHAHTTHTHINQHSDCDELRWHTGHTPPPPPPPPPLCLVLTLLGFAAAAAAAGCESVAANTSKRSSMAGRRASNGEGEMRCDGGSGEECVGSRESLRRAIGTGVTGPRGEQRCTARTPVDGFSMAAPRLVRTRIARPCCAERRSPRQCDKQEEGAG